MESITPREKMRALLASNGFTHPVSVYDPISARMAEELGFDVGIFASSIASATVLGAPDLSLLTLTEFAQQLRRICRASNLSLMADADHGYGNALNVMRTVEELEWAGVSALTIEDTVLPRVFGSGNELMISEHEMNIQDGLYLPTHGEDKLLTIDEGVGKMKAALTARRDSHLAVVARTSSMRITGLEDTIKRTQAYERAGVDALFLAGLSSGEQLEALRNAVSLPLILGGNVGELAEREYLQSAGVTFGLQGHLPFLAGVKAIYDTLNALREGSNPEDLYAQIATPEFIDYYTCSSDYRDRTENFLH